MRKRKLESMGKKSPNRTEGQIKRGGEKEIHLVDSREIGAEECLLLL